MGIAIAIVAVVALAVVGLLVTARSRATTGRLSRETRKRDDAAGASTVPEAAAPGRRGRHRARAPVKAGRSLTRRRGPQGHRVRRLGGARHRGVEHARGLRARRPRRARRHPAPVLQPVDPRRVGLGLGAFGVAALAFLWPSAGGGFGGKIVVGSEADAKDAFDNKIPFYNAAAKTYIVAYPKADLPKAKKVPGTPRRSSPAWSRATSRCTRSACTSAAACRGARARSGSSARATARSTTGSARSRVARPPVASTASR